MDKVQMIINIISSRLEILESVLVVAKVNDNLHYATSEIIEKRILCELLHKIKCLP